MCKNNKNINNSSKWVFLSRQILICSGIWAIFFIQGINIGATTVLVPQLRIEANSTDAVTPEQASWLAAIINYAAIPWMLLLPLLADYFGKKVTIVFISISTSIGYIIFYCSSDIEQIIISEIFQAVSSASTFVLISMITEYTFSDLRGVFLTIQATSFYWGILAANSIGTFFHWKYMPVFGFLCSTYSMLNVYFWPESPLWLANKGRLDQCAESHRWLMGSNEKSEKELYKLIADTQTPNKKVSWKCQITDMMKTVVKKEFYKPVLLFLTLVALHLFSGKLVCIVYAIDILKKITSSTSTAYAGMLILDTITALTMYIGCACAKKLKRRSLLFSCTTIAIVFLLLLSLYLYLVKLDILYEDNYVSLALLIGYSITIGCGPMILSTSIGGELVPLESRTLSLCTIGLMILVFYGTFMKIGPYFFIYFDMHGTFFFFGMTSIVFTIILYYYLPETKDKTLQEIQNDLNGTKPVEESKELLPIDKHIGEIVPKTERKLDLVL